MAAGFTARFAPLPALFVSYAGVLGGAERLLLDVAGGLRETPSLACPAGPLAERARAAGLHVIELRERPLELRASGRDRVAGPLRIAAHARELRSLVRALRPDLLVAWGMRPLLAAATLGRRRPPLLFQHNDLLPGPGIARAVRAAAGRADAVCAPSECIARDLSLPARVINPGVDLGRFQQAPPPDGPPEVIVLGAIVRWKRPDLALEAIGKLPDLRLRIAGHPLDAEGERLLDELRRRAAQPDLEGRVELAGLVDAADALARATCLLHCAEREPYGMVVAEALAAGRPAVVPASCGPAEIVDESCGRLYPPGDAEAAANAVVEVLRDARALGTAARERAERLYDVAKTRRGYAALVEELSSAGTRVSGVGNGLALITVAHNSERDLPRLLGSVRAHLPGARVVVVDSGSSDGSAEAARRLGAHVIELGENVGYGRASNAGVEHVEEPVTVVLNPDVELVDDSLALLAEELRRSDRILAPLVLRPDGSRQDSAQAEPGSAAAAVIALIPPVLMPAPLRSRICPWTSGGARRVGWAVGCCVAARTETLRKLGPFDERTFMYGEDLELGLRAADHGVETWFQPEARVIHYGAHSTEPAFGGEPFELLARQRHRVVAARRGARRARIDDVLQAATFANRIALKTLTGRNSRRERRQLRALGKAGR
jgi:N-acetylglucosaminyl-diphospho-decaprenol L-rhamnosyltransferase